MNTACVLGSTPKYAHAVGRMPAQMGTNAALCPYQTSVPAASPHSIRWRFSLCDEPSIISPSLIEGLMSYPVSLLHLVGPAKQRYSVVVMRTGGPGPATHSLAVLHRRACEVWNLPFESRKIAGTPSLGGEDMEHFLKHHGVLKNHPRF